MKRVAAVGALSLLCVAGLGSCGDDHSTSSLYDKIRGKASTTTAGKEAPVAEPSAVADSAEKEELFRYFLFSVADELRQQANQARWRDVVRDMRNKIEAYYTAVKSGKAELSAEDAVGLGLLLADTTRDLAAYDKAMTLYEAVQKDWDALPEDVRNSANGRRLSSALANGTAFCLLAQRKVSDALPYYEKALQIDRERFDQLAPANDAPLPTGDGLSDDLAKAAEDALSSYRCLGDAQLLADDPELARDTYTQGQELAKRMNNLAPAMTIQYIKLLSSLGNLESRVGSPKKALAAWVEAAKLSEGLRRVAPSLAVQQQAILFLRGLGESIKTVSAKVKRDAKDAEDATKTEQPPAPEGEAPASPSKP